MSEGVQVQAYCGEEAQEGKRTSSVSHPKSRQSTVKSNTMQEKNLLTMNLPGLQNEDELKNLNTASKQPQA